MNDFGMNDREDATNPDVAEIRAALQSEFRPLFPELQERADADTAWPSPKDASITACALMVKGICATQPEDQWAAKIEERVRYMLKSQERALLADGGKGEAGEAYAKGYKAGKAFAQRHAPQAECAPREAQTFADWIESVPPLTWEGWGRREAAHAAWIASRADAAPTPERVDAEKDAALTVTTQAERLKIMFSDGEGSPTEPVYDTSVVKRIATQMGWAKELQDRIAELERERAEALLDAERAREERNREHVRLNAEWMAKCEELRKDSERYRWIIKNMTFYNTAESEKPVLAEVSERIWYHATDDMTYPLSEVIDAALAKKEGA